MVPITPTSPKAIAATLGSLLVSIALAIVLALTTDPNALGELPGWLRSLLVIALPPLAAFLSAYVKRDPLRDVGQITLDQQRADVGGSQAPYSPPNDLGSASVALAWRTGVGLVTLLIAVVVVMAVTS